MRNHKGAAFIASTMLMAQSEPLDNLMYYDARPGGMNGLYETDDVTVLRPGYYAFYMFNKLYTLGTQVYSVVDGEDIEACAAAGDDYAVMLSHFNDDDDTKEKEVKINFKNVKSDNGIKLEYYLHDKDHECKLIREEIFTAEQFASYIKMPIYSNCLLKIVKL